MSKNASFIGSFSFFKRHTLRILCLTIWVPSFLQGQTEEVRAISLGVTVKASNAFWQNDAFREQKIPENTITGYRLRVFSQAGANGRAACQGVRENIRQKFGENIAVDIDFQQPVWIVKVGHFRTMSDAMQLKFLFRREYPHSLIVRESIFYRLPCVEPPKE